MKNRRIHSEQQVQPRHCEMEGCTLSGDFPAPRDRNKLRDYSWFCLQHVRAYNLGWNYYKGMTQGEVDAHNRSDITWQRPTWSAKTTIRNHYEQITTKLFDDYTFLRDDVSAKPIRHKDPESMFFSKNTPAAKALIVLKIEQPVTLLSLKKSYKEMVKLYHPDKNKGCKKSEEKLKTINIAFATVVKAFKNEQAI